MRSKLFENIRRYRRGVSASARYAGMKRISRMDALARASSAAKKRPLKDAFHEERETRFFEIERTNAL
ncbi:hypothetical protein NDU88_003313 [Pleurodeles waltl]|uniref:Uncharacterized protein n=1 Tax=Pleurodeles waltl TaxID=8319 RepID=A0AAV7UBR2_PLEWA|nr:hypothetical protein NDU88_003313 [Pleurodeles waltl]